MAKAPFSILILSPISIPPTLVAPSREYSRLMWDHLGHEWNASLIKAQSSKLKARNWPRKDSSCTLHIRWWRTWHGEFWCHVRLPATSITLLQFTVCAAVCRYTEYQNRPGGGHAETTHPLEYTRAVYRVFLNSFSKNILQSAFADVITWKLMSISKVISDHFGCFLSYSMAVPDFSRDARVYRYDPNLVFMMLIKYHDGKRSLNSSRLIQNKLWPCILQKKKNSISQKRLPFQSFYLVSYSKWR